MATSNGKARCITCGKEKSTVRCDGCSQPFCYNHLGTHRQDLSKQLDDIEVTRDLIQQTLLEHIGTPEKHPLIQQIDQWEHDSIEKIRQTAEETRQLLLKHTTRYFAQIETGLDKLSSQLRESRHEDDFFEKDLRNWNQQLTKFKEELNNPSIITIRNESVPLINKILVDITIPLNLVYIGLNAQWNYTGETVVGGNGAGNETNQLNFPYGLYVDDDDQTILIADYSNHRILEWNNSTTNSEILAGGNGQGNRNDQLSYPTDVIIDKITDSLIICDNGNRRVVRWPRRNGTNGETIISNIDCYGLTMDTDRYLYISDFNKHEVRRWKIGETSGTLVAGGNGQGERHDKLSGPTYLFVDQDRSLYVVDQNNHRVMKWINGARQGIVVAGSQNRGNSLRRLNYPRGIVVDQLGTVYVADYYNHRIMRWLKGASQGSIVIGRYGQGNQLHQLNGPWDLALDKQGNLYVVDACNHRVQKFNIEHSSIL